MWPFIFACELRQAAAVKEFLFRADTDPTRPSHSTAVWTAWDYNLFSASLASLMMLAMGKIFYSGNRSAATLVSRQLKVAKLTEIWCSTRRQGYLRHDRVPLSIRIFLHPHLTRYCWYVHPGSWFGSFFAKTAGHKSVSVVAAEQRKRTLELKIPTKQKAWKSGLRRHILRQVQESSNDSPSLLSDQGRALNFYCCLSQRGYDDLRARILAETATNGKKTSMKTSFSEANLLTMWKTVTPSAHETRGEKKI